MDDRISLPHLLRRELRDTKPVALAIISLATEKHGHSLACIYRLIEALQMLYRRHKHSHIA
jgi:hypothetical protein